MTLAEQLKNEGKIEEKMETVNIMLEEGFDPLLIAKATRFPLAKIKALQEKHRKPNGGN